MTTKADFTNEEWQNVVKAPMSIGGLVIMASFSIGDTIFESLSIGKKLAELTQTAKGDTLMAALAADYADKENSKALKEALKPSKEESRDPAAFKAKMLGDLKSAVAAIDAKASPEEAAELKQWLYSVGEATANAAKEGDFMGIGGQRVSPEEEAVLAEIKSALGL
ncbi:MAG: hypothetical protein KDJ65_37990 [Anaerolineae bacterium]|nr:hypothetical protein [Anaerolineae bacterium]